MSSLTNSDFNYPVFPNFYDFFEIIYNRFFFKLKKMTLIFVFLNINYINYSLILINDIFYNFYYYLYSKYKLYI